MTDDELEKLVEKIVAVYYDTSDYPATVTRDALKLVRDRTREDAAKVCEARAKSWETAYGVRSLDELYSYSVEAAGCASAIRGGKAG